MDNREDKHKELKGRFDRNNIMLGLSAVVILIGLIVGYIWFTEFSRNMLVGVVSLGFLAGGYFMGRHYWRQRGGGQVIVAEKPVPTQQVNSVCIYPHEIVFQDVDKPRGQPQKCLNDNKNYFVHVFDETSEKLEPFQLPDQQYYDPPLFAQRVLSLPAHRRVFRRKQSMFQKLSPFIMVLVIIIEWIIIVTTTG